jgi:hypothetical protein
MMRFFGLKEKVPGVIPPYADVRRIGARVLAIRLVALDDAVRSAQMAEMTDSNSSLDDPDYSEFAWSRFRRILKAMAVVSVLTGLVALGWMYYFIGGMTIAIALATVLGVGLTVFMAAALMGLVFLSSGSGHDEQVDAQGKKSAQHRNLKS